MQNCRPLRHKPESRVARVLLIFEAESIEAVCEILGGDAFLSEEVLRAGPVLFSAISHR